MNEPLWTLSDVSLGRRVRRLASLSVTIRPGANAVIGPSGAGKTSLLNILVNFEPPTGGQLRRSINISSKQLPVGWVPPDFGLWPHMTVRQHLESVEPAEGPSMTAHLLDRFGLANLAHADVARLSQGERSRLSLARALASDPAVLVLDEPLVHVDPVHVDDCWQILREHCQRQQTSLVFSTHDPAVVLREADRVLCLDEGRLAYEGTTEDLYHRPPTSRLSRFLGPANWFEKGDLSRWIAEPPAADSDLCLRPEQIEVAPDVDSPLVVESTQAGPMVSISHVRDERSARLRPVYHRTTTHRLEQGTRVLLRMCMVLLMLLMIAGCQRSSAAPTLPVMSTRTLKMAVDGGSIPAPRALNVSPDGELYVLDKAGRVLVYDNDGELARSWWMPEYEIGKPEGVCILDDGRVVVADTHYHRVVTFDRDGKVLSMFGELGEGPGQFIYPVSVTHDDAGHLYVAEYGGNDRIQKFTTDGEWILTMGSFGTEPGQFQRPSGIVWRSSDTSPPAAASGTLYVADAINNRVQAFSDDGEFLSIIAGWTGGNAEAGGDSSPSISLDFPYDISLGPDGKLFVVEYGAGRVTSLTAEGTLLGVYGSNGRDNGQFWTPWGIAVGDDGRIYIADTGNKRIVELTP